MRPHLLLCLSLLAASGLAMRTPCGGQETESGSRSDTPGAGVHRWADETAASFVITNQDDGQDLQLAGSSLIR
ncbi:MAG: hypothetical protein AAGA03_10745, partial [Planctomycetota bacterium]